MTQLTKLASIITKIAAGLSIMLTVVGCSSVSSDDGSPPSAQDQQKVIQNIQNNPHMSPEAKASAIAMLKNPPGASQRPRTAQQ